MIHIRAHPIDVNVSVTNIKIIHNRWESSCVAQINSYTILAKSSSRANYFIV